MMSADASRNVPDGYRPVDPWVISGSSDAAIAFMTEVFGASERPGSRVLNADGSVGHVEVELDGSVILMFDSQPGWAPTPAHLRVYVNDAQAAVDCAVAAGARKVTAVTALAFGERVARVRDPQGHLWWIHEHFEDVDPDDLPTRLADASTHHAMAYVQQSLAEELSRREEESR